MGGNGKAHDIAPTYLSFSAGKSPNPNQTRDVLALGTNIGSILWSPSKLFELQIVSASECCCLPLSLLPPSSRTFKHRVCYRHDSWGGFPTLLRGRRSSVPRSVGVRTNRSVSGLGPVNPMLAVRPPARPSGRLNGPQQVVRTANGRGKEGGPLDLKLAPSEYMSSHGRRG